MTTARTPIEEFDAHLSSADFVFLVYYRGHWCPFCISYLKTLTALSPTISAAHGTPVIVTSEPASHLPTTRSLTGYTGAAIVDPENVLVAELERRGLVDVAVSGKGGYEHGMAQPAVLVMKEGGEVLFEWAIVPGLMNLGGAIDRPVLNEVWENVEAKLEGKPPVREKFSSQPVAEVFWEKIFG